MTSIEDNLYAKMCLEVMNHIYDNIYSVKDEDGKINEQNYMMNFAYLLGCKLGDEGQLVGGEVEKVIHLFSDVQEVRKLRERLKRDGASVIVKPDLVIHTSHVRNNLDNEHQKLVIEAKTSKLLSKDAFCWDLLKLYAYKVELRFDIAIFLIVNQTEKNINKLLAKYENGKFFNDDNLEKIVFLIQEDVNSRPLVYKLQRE